MSGRRIYLNIRNKIRGLLNPELCQVCGIPSIGQACYCPDCLQNFTLVHNPCQLCGEPNRASGDVCPACLKNPPRWQRMIAPCVYHHSIRQQIHLLKFNHRIELAAALVTVLQQHFKQRPVETVIPVPLHHSRLCERGFNQSLEIANALSRALDIPLDSRSLQRTRATQPQSGLSPRKRSQNIRRAFEFKGPRRYQSVAVIDDVITSGSTMDEICRILNRAGIEHVEVWSLARALKQR